MVRIMGLFDEKVVIITGAGRGIGKAHANGFAKEGAKVVVNDLGTTLDGSGTTVTTADAVVKEICNEGGQAIANYDTVDTVKGANSIIQTALDNFGQIDILVNNAGILRDKSLLKMEEKMWDLVISVHLKGTFTCTQAAARVMRGQQTGGSIINTTSITGIIGNFGQANYGAAKAGIIGFTKVAAIELERYSINVNAISPLATTRMKVFKDNPQPAINYAVRSLKEGFSVLVAPQGKRINSTPLDDYFGFVKEGKSGVGRIILAMNGEIPIIPAYVHGTSAALKIGKFLPIFGRYIALSFGEPLSFHQYARHGGWSKQQPDYFIKAREIANQVMSAIREQLLEIEKYYFQFLEWKIQVPMSKVELMLKDDKRMKRLSRKLTYVQPKRLREYLESKQYRDTK